MSRPSLRASPRHVVPRQCPHRAPRWEQGTFILHIWRIWSSVGLGTGCREVSRDLQEHRTMRLTEDKHRGDVAEGTSESCSTSRLCKEGSWPCPDSGEAARTRISVCISSAPYSFRATARAHSHTQTTAQRGNNWAFWAKHHKTRLHMPAHSSHQRWQHGRRRSQVATAPCFQKILKKMPPQSQPGPQRFLFQLQNFWWELQFCYLPGKAWIRHLE